MLRDLYRHAYDGKYEYCIKTLVDVIEKQDKVISDLNNRLTNMESRLNRDESRLLKVEKDGRLAKELVVNDAIDETLEPMSLKEMVEQATKKVD